jgi:hypothetical protein
VTTPTDAEVATSTRSAAEAAGHEVATSRLRWWREVLYIGAFYALYTWIRNQFGSASVDSFVAYDHALLIIDIERSVGLFHEESARRRSASATRAVTAMIGVCAPVLRSSARISRVAS